MTINEDFPHFSDGPGRRRFDFVFLHGLSGESAPGHSEGDDIGLCRMGGGGDLIRATGCQGSERLRQLHDLDYSLATAI